MIPRELNQNNKLDGSNLNWLAYNSERRQTRAAFGWFSEHAKQSELFSILIGQSNKSLSMLGISLAGKLAKILSTTGG